VLAHADLKTSPAAVGRVIGSLELLERALDDTQWGVLRAMRNVTDQRSGAAQGILGELVEVLTHDEHVHPLKEAVAKLGPQAVRVLSQQVITPTAVMPADPSRSVATDPIPPMPLPPKSPLLETLEQETPSALSPSEADTVLQDLRSKLMGQEGVELSLTWRLERRRPD